ncbi:MAG: hypothetical protein KF857_00280 [Fimbriimonadaceae bacterium]|nr:hypothetical protein [Fimbriimonadaceae bacterium]
MEIRQDRLELTEDEAFALLTLAMTSGIALDSVGERAVRKLAEHCKVHTRKPSNHRDTDREFCEAG